jgi:RNA polymerase sigma factor (sigma-70 family)
MRANPNGEQQEVKGAMATSESLSGLNGALGLAMQSGFKRTRSWRVPPNWSQDDWLEELTAVATAAAWQALCDFDPERGVPLAGFGYCRIISRCLARYRKEWRYALHLVASDSREEESTTFERPELNASSAVPVNGTHRSSDDLRGAIRALPAKQRRLIEQLFWEERTETEVANTMNINQSTINRRKRTILKSLRMKLYDRNEIQKICIKLLVVSNLTNSLVELGDVALGA